MSRSPLPNPRNCTINFRLTAQELDEVKLAAGAQGQRCLSDFARSAVLAQAHMELTSEDSDGPSAPPADPEVSRRARIVTFRVTEEEFETLKSIHQSSGIPSVSELARSAIDRFVKERTNGRRDPVRSDISIRLAELDVRLERINGQVERLNQIIESEDRTLVSVED